MNTKPKYVYTINEKGVVFRGEKGADEAEAIAGVKDGKLQFTHPRYGKYHLPVRKFFDQPHIAEKWGPVEVIMPDPDRKPVVRHAVQVHPGTTTPAEPERSMFISSTSDEEAKMNTDGPDGLRSLTVEQRKAVNLLRSKEGFPIGELERPATAPPRKTSGAGDKTPAYVLHLLRYHPAEFVRVYGVERVGSIEIRIPGAVDPITKMRGPARRRWEGGHVIAKRATMFTHVVVNRPEDQEDEASA